MLQGVPLIINRAGIHNNYVHGQGIIVEDRLNCSGICHMKCVIVKIHTKKVVVCILRKISGNKELLFLILFYHKLS